MIKGFKEFLFRGNVVDLAVAVVIGAAFGMVITAVVDGFINPLIAAIFGKPNLGETWTFEINGAEFSLGLILDAVLNFVLVAAAIYFVIIVPMNRVMSLRRRPEETPVEVTPEEVVLLREIRDSLARRP